MRRMTLFLIAILALPALMEARGGRLGGFGFGGGYYGSYYGPGWGWYDPFFSPYGYPGMYGGRFAGPGLGELKLHAPKTAEVFVDGAYAGEAGKLKTMWMRPGAYNLEVKAGGQSFSRRVFVLSGRSLRIDTELKQP